MGRTPRLDRLVLPPTLEDLGGGSTSRLQGRRLDDLRRGPTSQRQKRRLKDLGGGPRSWLHERSVGGFGVGPRPRREQGGRSAGGRVPSRCSHRRRGGRSPGLVRRGQAGGQHHAAAPLVRVVVAAAAEFPSAPELVHVRRGPAPGPSLALRRTRSRFRITSGPTLLHDGLRRARRRPPLGEWLLVLLIRKGSGRSSPDLGGGPHPRRHEGCFEDLGGGSRSWWDQGGELTVGRALPNSRRRWGGFLGLNPRG